MPDDTFSAQKDEVPSTTPTQIVETRNYQLEILEESLRRNIIIALDTGAGKTHIAILRMKHEIERESPKVITSSLYPIHHNIPQLLVSRAIYASLNYLSLPTQHRSPGSLRRQSRSRSSSRQSSRPTSPSLLDSFWARMNRTSGRIGSCGAACWNPTASSSARTASFSTRSAMVTSASGTTLAYLCSTRLTMLQTNTIITS